MDKIPVEQHELSTSTPNGRDGAGTLVARPKRKPPPVGDRGDKQARKKYGRTKVSSGKQLLPGVLGTNIWARRCKDILNDYLSDVPDASTAERSIIRRIAVLTVELEQLEVKFATAGTANSADLDLYQRTSGGLRRLLATLGLQRRAKPVLNISEKLEQKRLERERQAPIVLEAIHEKEEAHD
jgi:hypothetical protein